VDFSTSHFQESSFLCHHSAKLARHKRGQAKMTSGRHRSIIAALIAIVLAPLTFGPANAQSCSNASLNGSCVLQAVASPSSAGGAAGGGPESLVGLITFDGAGNFTMRLHKNANGTFIQTDVTGTYTVEANCDGSYTYTNANTGDVDTHDFVLSESGMVLREILRSTQGRSTTLRVTAGVCKFNE
jgi:hypothetical protein